MPLALGPATKALVMLLLLEGRKSQREIARLCKISLGMVAKIKKKLALEGCEASSLYVVAAALEPLGPGREGYFSAKFKSFEKKMPNLPCPSL